MGRSETRIVAASSVENCELCVIFVPQFPICMSCIIPRLFRSNSITNAAKHCTVAKPQPFILLYLHYSRHALPNHKKIFLCSVKMSFLLDILFKIQNWTENVNCLCCG